MRHRATSWRRSHGPKRVKALDKAPGAPQRSPPPRPTTDHPMHFWGHIASSIGNYGYAAVAAGLLLEHIGLPLPGETLLIAAALLAAHGSLAIVPLLVLA